MVPRARLTSSRTEGTFGEERFASPTDETEAAALAVTVAAAAGAEDLKYLWAGSSSPNVLPGAQEYASPDTAWCEATAGTRWDVRRLFLAPKTKISTEKNEFLQICF